MLLAIVNCWLVALERGFMNPLQALALVLWYTCAGHQEPACGELCLGIAAIGRQLIPLSIPVNRGSGVSQRGKHSMNRLSVALVSLDLRSRHLTLGRVDEYITLLSLNRCLLTIAISLVSFLGHSFLLNDLHDTGQSQISTDTISLHLPALSPPQNHGCSGAS